MCRLASPVARLPSSVGEWRSLIRRALTLDLDSVRLPPQFSIVNAVTGECARDFGDAPRTARPASSPMPTAKHAAKRSAVMMCLMPAAASGASPSSRRPWMSCYEVGATGRHYFSRNGQPKQDGRDADAPLIEFEGLDLILPVTQRTSKLRSHSGQMSFPGGRCDGGETYESAAIRETLEEVGVAVSDTAVVGKTSQLYSFPAKAIVEPVVAVTDDLLELRVASPDEVESIHYMSLGALIFDGAHHHRIHKDWETTGPLRLPAFYDVEGKCVWGLTAFCLGELVARVGTVMDHTELLPESVLRGWGDDALIKYRYLKVVNPYVSSIPND